MIVFLSTRYSVGGAQMNAVMLAEQFAARGEAVELWFLMKTGEMAQTTAPVRIISPTPPKGLKGWLALLGNFVVAIRQHKPRGMFAFHPLACILGALGRVIGGYRFVATQNNPPESQTAVLGLIEGALGSTPLYTANIAVSDAVKMAYGRYPASYRRKMITIHNATPPLPELAEDREACRRRLGLPLDAFIFGAVGRLAEQKYPDFLVPVLERTPDAHLALAGDGPLRETMHALAARHGVADRLHLLGGVGGEDVSRVYRALDLFVMPSRFEGFGRTLVEAFQAGTPALVNDIAVLREVGGDAVRFAPLDHDAWADEIQALIAHPEARSDLIERGRRRALLFTLDGMIDSYRAAIANRA